MFDQFYCNKPLRGPRHIRLLKLLPGSWEDEIFCELEVTSLNQHPRYEALSYAWATEGESQYISLDGQQFSISATLRLALRRLRRPDSSRNLWVDSLCVNQSDVSERNNQVALMKDIFLNQPALIWLGDPDPKGTSSGSCEPEWGNAFVDSQRIFQFKQRLNNSHGLPIAIRHHREQDYELGAFCFIVELASDKHLSDISLLKKVLYWKNVSKTLLQIIQQDWWTRIWAVQEAVLAPQATVMYGRFSCSWEIFASAAKNFTQHRLACCSEFLDGLHPSYTEILRNFSRAVLSIEEARHQWKDQQDTTLLQLLWQFRSRRSIDPRDKVYSLVSLVKSWGPRLAMHTDYSLTPEMLYRTVVRELIIATGDLSVLIGSTKKSQALNSLPSWIPDWTVKPSPFERDRLERVVLYSASAHRLPSIKYPGDTFLESSGIIVATINTVGNIMTPNFGEPAIGESALEVFKHWENLAGVDRDPHRTYVGGGTAVQAYWRTLCLDSLPRTEAGPSGFCKRKFVRAPPEYGSSIEFWRRKAESWSQDQESKGANKRKTVLTDNRLPPELQRYWIELQNGPITRPPTLVEAIDYAVRSATANRRFFMTDQGCYMGLGSSTLKMGDKICVLLGGRTPFIVRPTGTRDIGESTSSPCYDLIGDCYVDGLMDGQVFRIPGLKEEPVLLGPCAPDRLTVRAKL